MNEILNQTIISADGNTGPVAILDNHGKSDEERCTHLCELAHKETALNPAKAHELADTALRIAKEHNFQGGIARAYNEHALIFFREKDYQAAMRLARQTLESCRGMDEDNIRQSALLVLGRSATAAGEYQTALEAHFENQSIQERLNLDKALAKTLMDISRVYMLLDAYSVALDFCLKSLTIRRRIGERSDISIALNNLGMIWSQIGDHSQALEFYQECSELQKQAPPDPLVCGTNNNIAETYLAQGDLDTATTFAYLSLDAARESNLAYVESLALGTLGQINLKRQNLYSARKYFIASIDLAHTLELKQDAARGLHSLAKVALQLNDIDSAIEHINALMPIVDEFSMGKLEYAVELTLSEIYAQRKDFELAYKHLARHQKLKAQFVDEREQKRLRDIVVVRRVEKWRSQVEDYRRDVDKLAALNERLRELHDEKNEFLGIAAHDLKNPLSGIVLTAEGLIDHIDLLSKADIVHRANVIHTASNRMNEIIGSLLDINALESGTMQLEYSKFNIADLMQDVVAVWKERAKKKRIRIETEVKPQRIDMYLDQSKMHQVLDNLLSNAIKFSQPDRTVRIRATGKPDGSAKIFVEDQGPGLTPEDQRRLYSKFSRLSARPTANENSTGLGLSIVKKLLKMMQAEIHCESELGKGTSFIVSLPRQT